MQEPPTPVLVAYDGSTDADLALDWAAAAVQPRLDQLEVMIVGTHMDPVVGHYRADNEKLVDEGHLRATQRLKDLGVANWDVEVVRGPTVPVLLAAAVRARMVVVGSRGHTLVLGSVSGSVSQHLARRSPCPVVVVRPPRNERARRIVVGVDGSGGAERALRFACGHARDTGETVLAVHSYRSDQASARTGPRRHNAERLLETCLTEVSCDPDLHLTTRVVAGHAGRLLVDLSEDASLVVVGSRGRDPVAEVLLGSVAQHVLQHAHCPVAVVR